MHTAAQTMVQVAPGKLAGEDRRIDQLYLREVGATYNAGRVDKDMQRALVMVVHLLQHLLNSCLTPTDAPRA